MSRPEEHANKRTGVLPKPEGLVRLIAKGPVLLYRMRMGWLLGHRALMLTHRGRKSGLVRRTVVGVFRYNKATEESIVVGSYGEKSDWYRNIQASPALRIDTGSSHYTPEQHLLTPDEAYEVFARYGHRHPFWVRTLVRLAGAPQDDLSAAYRVLGEAVPVVAFRPRGRTKRDVSAADVSENTGQ
jgi:deazaflavin-dependent oxidoreductase (nitroreductase family)